MNSPFVSIVVPIYNVEQYLKECLDSVAHQSFKGLIECILVDDCGNDNSVHLAEEYVKNDAGNIHFRLIHHEHNKGLSGARNTGLMAASGKYVYFLDSDDFITTDCIDQMARLAEKYSGVDIVQGGAISHMKYLSLKGKHLPEYSCDREWIRRTFLRNYDIPVTAWNKLVRREFLLSNGLFFLEGAIHEDEAWNFDLAHAVSSIAFCSTDTYFYRINEKGIMLAGKGDNLKGRQVWEYIAKKISTPDIYWDVICFLAVVHPSIEWQRYVSNKGEYGSLLVYLTRLRRNTFLSSRCSVYGIFSRMAYHSSLFLIHNDTIAKLLNKILKLCAV